MGFAEKKTSEGRVAVIGLDGATFALLDQFMASGIMPNLQRAIDGGCRAVLRSTKPPITGCAWPTMYTGGEPGQHSIFDFRRPLRHPDLKRRFINSSSIRMPKIWEILGEEEAQSFLLNLPITYPPFEVHGKLISGMPLPSDATDISYPSTLIDEIHRECGGYIPDIDFLRGEIPDIDNEDALSHFLKELSQALDYRLRASQYLITHEGWRLFFMCFILPDRVQHLYYSLLDEEVLVRRKPDKAAFRLRDKLLGLYAELDVAIGDLVERLDPNDTIFFVSDHGFGPLNKIFHLNTWLSENGYIKLKPGEGRKSIGSFLPESMKRPLRSLLRRKAVAPEGYNPLAMIDWGNTRAFSASSTEQGVYLNVKGREPFGIVEQGLEYITLRDELIEKLIALTDPSTGGKIFDVVLPREDVQTGRFIDDAPDIFIQPTRHETVMAEEFVEPLIIPWHHPYGGFHREEGIFIATGPCINKGRLPDIEMTQVLPTLLQAMRLPVPDWVEGIAPDGLFTTNFLAEYPLVRKSYPELSAKYEDASNPDTDNTGGEDLLKGLGYIN